MATPTVERAREEEKERLYVWSISFCIEFCHPFVGKENCFKK
jgi:hypothetical protein